MTTKPAFLKKDSQERFTTKRAWFATAWRIVDRDGCDLVQPWCRTKKEALETASSLGYTIEGVRA
ncbi:hypothetical protein HOV23_gp098 [Pseudomonas phage Lana]|uniref:Uncharacterized protein n=1 Tax=Pseudomonas phage Lana TaxID=2530172 RepID=A0A481W682_9CAUD|nr:hypothetical protein HOV23_gp098 [Pseudomonas phage Lana]QBJ04475.1 hypothetical protein [Pseudomonas phage Lana]